MKRYLLKLLTLMIALTILIGIPYYFGTVFLWLSWIPAAFTYDELSNEIN